jgi:hypothetical protein
MTAALATPARALGQRRHEASTHTLTHMHTHTMAHADTHIHTHLNTHAHACTKWHTQMRYTNIYKHAPWLTTNLQCLALPNA